MKKRLAKKSKSPKKIGLFIFIIALVLFVFATAFQTEDYYGVAIGILAGFLIYFLFNKTKN